MAKVGNQSFSLNHGVSILNTASIVGNKEGEGPIAGCFDRCVKDALFDQPSWEQAESAFVRETIQTLSDKAQVAVSDVDYIISGDLLNQTVSSTFGIVDYKRPYLGVFSACATIAEAMAFGAALVDGCYADKVIACASSHFCSAEKQFRNPLELGTQRPLTSTWTVTGAGALLLAKTGPNPYIKGATIGKIVDMGQKDANNMGAAMAAAAADTIINHFRDFNRTPNYYDVIATGDLGYVGRDLVMNMLSEEGYDLSKNYTDCGIEIFDRETQDTHSGGSGCACSAVTFAGMYYKKFVSKEIQRMLFVPTGALLSTTSSQQGKSIPGIAHAVIIENQAGW